MTAFSTKSLNFLKSLAKDAEIKENRPIEVKQIHSPLVKGVLPTLEVGSILLFKYVLIEVKTKKKGWISGKRDVKNYRRRPRRRRNLEVLGMLVNPVTLVSPLKNTLVNCVNLTQDQITSLDDLKTLYTTGTRIPNTHKTYRLGAMYNIKHINYEPSNNDATRQEPRTSQ
jgi:hypothetical protein